MRKTVSILIGVLTVMEAAGMTAAMVVMKVVAMERTMGVSIATMNIGRMMNQVVVLPQHKQLAE